MKQFVKISGFLSFIILSVFALLFFKERTVTFDMAYQEFYVILTRSFVWNLRIGAIIPQVIPLILRCFNCPLKSILIFHSLGFVVFYFSFFLLIAFKWRQYEIALVYLLNSIMLVNDTFYWIQSELPQGLSWLILYYAYINCRGVADIYKRPALHWSLLLFLQLFHPLMFAPILYLILFLLYKEYGFKWHHYIWPLTMIFSNFIFRIWISRFNGYEHERLDLLGRLDRHRLFLEQFILDRLTISFNTTILTIGCLGGLFLVFIIAMRRYRSAIGPMLLLACFFVFVVIGRQLALFVPSVVTAFNHITSDYLVYCLVLLFTIGALIANRKLYLVSLLSVFTMTYIMLVCIANRSAQKFYLENLLLPIGIFVILPFVSILFNEFKEKTRLVLFILTVIISIRMVFIYDAHSPFTQRLTWYESKFNEMERDGVQRLMLTEKQVPMDTLIITWASGYESVILSSMEGENRTKSLVIDSDLMAYRPYVEKDNLLLAKWGVWHDEDLPGNYFMMRSGRYLVR